eukprot:7790680-Lingulodinium_polyedra.AAC.1
MLCACDGRPMKSMQAQFSLSRHIHSTRPRPFGEAGRPDRGRRHSARAHLEFGPGRQPACVS